MRLDQMLASSLKTKDFEQLAKETRGQLSSIEALKKLQDIKNKNKEDQKKAKSGRTS